MWDKTPCTSYSGVSLPPTLMPNIVFRDIICDMSHLRDAW